MKTGMGMIFDRRQFLGGAAGVLTLGAAARAGMASLTPGDGESLDFAVFRNGSEIGHHRLDIRHMGSRTTVEIDILLEVGIGPLTLFRYRHRNLETWVDGRFVSFVSETDDDGRDYAVRAVRGDKTISVERTRDDDYEIDDLSVLPTTYWNSALTQCTHVLDTQKGRLMAVEVDTGDWQAVRTAAGTVEARRFNVTGDLTLSLWYDRHGRWTKLYFPFKDDDFDYVLA